MKLKATNESIYTLNKSLKNRDFNKNVIIKKNNIFGKFNLGFLENDNSNEDEIEITYCKNVSKTIKYLYHIKIMGPGLKFKHLAYTKATKIQALRLWFMFKFIPFFTNLENAIKIFTIIGSLISVFLLYQSVYVIKEPLFEKFNININYTDSLIKTSILTHKDFKYNDTITN